jgi:hypothetical protein
MPVLGDHPLTVRVSVALVLANARYWSTIAPLVRRQLDYWTQRAESIPDPVLNEIALANLRDEGFNAQATATLATLAPREHRTSVVQAIVGLQILYDYLDSLIERPLTDPLGDGRQLYEAFVDAIVLDNEPQGDYYPPTHESDDDGYLEELVSAIRRALASLPSQTSIAEVSAHAAKRCADAQIHAHATAVFGDAQTPGLAGGSFLPVRCPRDLPYTPLRSPLLNPRPHESKRSRSTTSTCRSAPSPLSWTGSSTTSRTCATWATPDTSATTMTTTRSLTGSGA